MPEGHSVHRIARQFGSNFVGEVVAVSSPQGRFAVGAAELDGRRMLDASAIGKHLLLGFDGGGGDGGRSSDADASHEADGAARQWLHVHLGIYGAWDFAGAITVDATIAGADGRMGQTHMRGTATTGAGAGAGGEHEDSVASIGAPRLARVRAGETERVGGLAAFPPEPVGQVRVRIATSRAVADLRGPTVCEVLDAAGIDRLVRRLGPDPAALHRLADTPTAGGAVVGEVSGAAAAPDHAAVLDRAAEGRFVASVARSARPVGQLLMDQSVVAGIGNVYRAELLFRAGLDPERPGNTVPEDEVRALWRDWSALLRTGIETGQMLTIDGLTGDALAAALAHREDRHWVYKREGLPCRSCGTPVSLAVMQGRKLYFCAQCQT